MEDIQTRQARASDARALAQLIDTAGEGIPHWLWSQWCEGGQTPLDVGESRAQRETGGFSYTNAVVSLKDDEVVGMILSYPITEAPTDDPNTLPAPIAPFVELEAKSIGSWYVNALAVRPEQRGKGIGRDLMRIAENLAKDQGFETVTIQVFEQNDGAYRLYRNIGYHAVEVSPVRAHPCQPYYTGDVVLLEKSLI